MTTDRAPIPGHPPLDWDQEEAARKSLREFREFTATHYPELIDLRYPEKALGERFNELMDKITLAQRKNIVY